MLKYLTLVALALCSGGRAIAAHKDTIDTDDHKSTEMTRQGEATTEEKIEQQNILLQKLSACVMQQEENMQKMGNQIVSLQGVVVAQDKQIAQKEGELKVLQEQVQRLKKSVRDGNAKVEELKAQVRQKDKQIGDLYNELGLLKEENRILRKERDELEAIEKNSDSSNLLSSAANILEVGIKAMEFCRTYKQASAFKASKNKRTFKYSPLNPKKPSSLNPKGAALSPYQPFDKKGPLLFVTYKDLLDKFKADCLHIGNGNALSPHLT